MTEFRGALFPLQLAAFPDAALATVVGDYRYIACALFLL